MAPLVDQLLLPGKMAQRALADLARVADAVVSAAVTLEAMREDLNSLRDALGPMSDDLDGLRRSFDRSNDELEQLREAMAPEHRGIREAIEGFPFSGGG
jgi:ABC-type transporter Mla subunit MlaD